MRRIKEYIAAGDTFQTVLSRRLEVPAPDPFLTYRYLRALNPAPYLYFLHCDDIHIIGSSPEVLIRVEDGEVTLRPIAGTRPRGATPEEDAALAAELPPTPRSGPNTSCSSTSAATTSAAWRIRHGPAHRVMAIERYSPRHAHRTKSRALRPDLDAFDALARLLPGGHGLRRPQGAGNADHRRAGARRRGPYAGAVGYIGWGARTLDTASPSAPA